MDPSDLGMEQHFTLQACRVCLKTSCRLYSISALGLSDIYVALSSALLEVANLPQVVCTVCAIQLRKAQQLADTSKWAHAFLLDKYAKNHKITIDNWRDTNRNSPLFKTVHFAPNHCDLHVKDTQRSGLEETVKEEDTEANQYLAVEESYYYGDSEKKLTVSRKLVENVKDEEINLSESDHDVFKAEEPIDEGSNLHAFIMNDVHNFEESQDSLNVAEDNKLIDNQMISRKRQLKENNHTKKMKSKTAPKTRYTKDSPKKTKQQSSLKHKINGKDSKPKQVLSNYNKKKLKENFDVQKLNLDEQKLELEKVKLKANYVKSPYKCETCFKGFKEEAIFNAHLVKHTESGGPHECPVCHLHFLSRRNCMTHTRIHEKLFICNQCPFRTQHKSATIHHLDWHRGTVHKCDLCSDVFNFETSLARHRRKHHPSPVTCVFCGRGCLDENGLRMHYDWKHAGQTIPEEGPRCEACDLTFVNDAALAKHRNSQHDIIVRKWTSSSQRRPKGNDEERQGEKKFTCNDCGKSFDKRHKLSYHMRKTHGPAQPTQPATRSDVDKKTQKVAQRKQCHVCGRFFQCAAHLRDHMDEHVDSASYKCSDCGKTYKTLTRMKTHQRSHSSQFSCPICQKTFNWPRNMIRHCNNVHKTARDVECSFCSKGFKCKAERRAHELYTHLKKPRPTRIRDRKRAGSPLAVMLTHKPLKTS